MLIPFAAATGDHQTANARGLVQAGGAILIPEKALNVDVLSEHINTVLTNPKAATLMANAAMGAGRPDATDRLVEMVLALSQEIE